MTTDRARRGDPVLEMLRLGGAGLLLAIGGIHLDLWITGYRHIGTVGELFLVQVVVSFLLALAVLVLPRWYVTAGAAVFAVGTLAGYELFRVTTVLGFHEVRTTAGFTAGVLEVLAFVLLGGYALLTQQRAATSTATPVARADRRLAASSSRIGVAGAVVAVLLVALVGVSAVPRHVSPSSAGSSATPGITIVIKNFVFVPAHATVAPGEVVKVVNDDPVAHTLTRTSGPGNFDTGEIPGGGSATFVAPRAPGTYGYRCTIHTFMVGTLTVS
jgi:plastocyanin